MTVRVLHLADLHLGWEPRFLPTEKAKVWRRERDGLLDLADDVVRREGVHLVLIAGDLFDDHRPPAALAERVAGTLARWEAAGVRVVTAPGNHDEITHRDSVYRERAASWPGVLVREALPHRAAVVEAGGARVHVYGFAFTGGRTPARLEEFPRAGDDGLHVGIFHGALDWDGGRTPCLVAKGLAASGYHYVALGHLHSHQVRVWGRTTAVYAGAVAGTDFSDPGEGMWTLVELDRDGAAVRRIQAGVRPLRVVEVNAGLYRQVGEMAEAMASMAEEEALVLFRVGGVCSFAWEGEAVAEILRRRYFHVRVEDRTEAVADAAVAALAREPTVAGTFARRLLLRMEAAGDEGERARARRALMLGLAALGFGRGGREGAGAR